MLFFDKNKTIGSQLQNFFIGFSVFCTIDQDLFFFGERNLTVVGFGVEIQAIKERTLVEILVFGDFEEIHLSHFGVANSIVPTQTGVASLNESVDANIFDNIQSHHRNLLRNASTARKSSHGGRQIIVGSVESVRDFVSHQHVGQLFAHVRPHGHRERTRFNVKKRRRSGGVNANSNVFGRQQFGEARRNANRGSHTHHGQYTPKMTALQAVGLILFRFFGYFLLCRQPRP